jgi:hypothetical protein
LEDLSLHILDVGENSLDAGATEIKIKIDEDTRGNKLVLVIEDNGRGLDEETQKKVLDPFYTTKKGKEAGLGISLLAQSAQEAGGDLSIKSQIATGTVITAWFVYDHLDRKPIGNMADTIIALLAGRGSSIDIVYEHCKDGDGFTLDTREIRMELQDVPLDNPEVLNLLKEVINCGLKDLEKEDK